MRLRKAYIWPLLSFVSLFCVVLGLFFAYQASAAAPQSISLTTTPVVLDLNISPGSSISKTIELMNNTTQPIQIVMKVMTFEASGTNGEAAINNFPSNNPDAGYIHFSPTTFTAQPKVWSKVQVNFSLPKSANLGYYYTFVFTPVYSGTTNPNGATVHGSNAVLALINTNSANEQRAVQVSSFSTSQRIYQFLPANFSVNIRNEGNIFLAPSGDIFISRGTSGKSIASIPINPGGGNVLPNSNRIFKGSWSNGFPSYKPVILNGQPEVSKSGQPVTKLDWSSSSISKFRFGKYYATLVMTYNNGSKTVLLHGTIDFYVIPWIILIAILFVIFLIGLNLYFISRSFYRKINKFRTKSKTKDQASA